MIVKTWIEKKSRIIKALTGFSGQVCLVLVHWSFGSVAEALVTGARAGAPPEWPAVGSGRCWPDT